MVQANYRTVWVSDLHLGTKACRVEPLLRFLSSITAEQIYLVGDIIDVWSLQRKWHWPSSHERVIHQILRHSREGTHVIFIPGNHDAVFRTYAGLDFGGIEIRREAVHRTADGRRVLILHGDEFDKIVHDHTFLMAVGDWFYDMLLALGRGYDRLRKKFGWPYWSPAAWAKQKVKVVVNFVSDYHRQLAEYARARCADVVVTGHIHRPEIKPMEDLVYANCGDWVESCSALVEHFDGTLELLRPDRDGLAPVLPAPTLEEAVV
jgi:UDP-2,3-diacylglucosamine pyrophosphatase LpxH